MGFEKQMYSCYNVEAMEKIAPWKPRISVISLET